MVASYPLGILRDGSMNPWIDVGLIFVFAGGCIALSFEIPRAFYEIRQIILETRDEED